MKNRLATLVLSLTVLFWAFALLPPGRVEGFDYHDPIEIVGNANFTYENGVVSGSGTWDDPYVISGWEIPVTTGRAIYIENASVHFRIENVYIHGATSGPGIYFFQSSNGTIANSLLKDNSLSVFFWFTSNITVSATSITGFDVGIRIANSSNVRVSGNAFESNRRLVDVRNSLFVSLLNNTASGGGIFIDGSLKEHFNTHEIAENNTVRGNPIKYLKNCDNLNLVSTRAAQLILANCSKVSLTGLSISGTETALEFAFVQDGIVSSSYFSKNYVGILQLYSSNVTYNDVKVSASHQAVRIRYSNFTTFSYCDIRSSHDGIDLSFSRNLTIYNTSFLSLMGYGIGSMYSSHILLEDSSFQEVIYGFIDWSGDNLTVVHNEFRNVDGAIRMREVNDSLIVGNLVIESGRALDAIWLHRATIMNNTALHIVPYAFEIWHMTNSTFEKNRIDDVSIYGVAVLFSSNNTFSDNSILNSKIGVGIYESHNNKFFHNNFINNSIQAFDKSADDNEWDDGYPSGGNYWSNYTGPDDFGGPDQDIPGSDGIRDIPFDFDPDTWDEYPLMDPIVVLPPDPPKNLIAELSGTGFENLTLSWDLSVDDINGLRSVVRYDILRGSNYSSDSSYYLLYDSLPKGSSQYVDIGAGEGDSNNYFYVVCAVDLNENFTCSREQTAKFTRPLSQGPNLVSIPLIQSNESIETVLQTVGYDKAWYYDSFSKEWKWHMRFKDYRRGLWNINHTMGLWINVTENGNLTVAGIVPAQTTMHLTAGWNLVGFPSFNSSFTVADLEAEVGSTRVEGFDPLAGPQYLRVLGDAEVLIAGYGYWARVYVDTVWTVGFS